MSNGRCRMHGGAATGAPKQNANAVKTGEHESIFLAVLDDAERQLWKKAVVTPRTALEEDLRKINIREFRMLKRLQSYREREAQMQGFDMEQLHVIEETHELSAAGEVNSESTKTKRQSITTTIQAIEEALTRVQLAKTRIVEALHKMDQDGKGDPDENAAKLLSDAITSSAALLAGQGKPFERVVPPNRSSV